LRVTDDPNDIDEAMVEPVTPRSTIAELVNTKPLPEIEKLFAENSIDPKDVPDG
jgi:hypothetical protein